MNNLVQRANELVKQLPLPEAKNPGAALLVKSMPRLVQYLPDNMAARQFCMALVQEANKLDSDVVPISVANSALACAIVGLIPGPALGHAYLVPFKNKGQKMCTFVPGYKGFLELAYGASWLADCQPEVILEGEEFLHWMDESGPKLSHNIPVNRKLMHQNVVGAYCVWHSRHGGKGIEVVQRSELDKVDTQKNVWASEYVAMAKKTPVRRASKLWRQTRGLALAVQLDEQQEQGEVQEVEGVKITDVIATSESVPVEIDLDTLSETTEED